MCSVWGMLLEQHPSHRTQSALPHPGPPTYYNIWTIHHIAVNHSLMLLKMGKRLPETCRANSKINEIVIVASSWWFLLFTHNQINSKSVHWEPSCSIQAKVQTWRNKESILTTSRTRQIKTITYWHILNNLSITKFRNNFSTFPALDTDRRTGIRGEYKRPIIVKFLTHTRKEL
jgi:hypothetical protein